MISGIRRQDSGELMFLKSMWLSLPFILESPNKKMMGRWYSQKKKPETAAILQSLVCDLSVQMGCFRQRAMRGDFQLYWEAVCCD